LKIAIKLLIILAKIYLKNMKKILIIQANYYTHISQMLLNGAVAELEKQGYKYEIIDVLGALEIPAAVAFANETDNYSGFVALGCVIRGETSHYDIVAGESANGLARLAMKKKLAIGNGILTTENEEQAIVRANPNQKDKGGFAAKACIEMIKLKKKFNL
jgi:6,7-dimethyl-8-ribityllumazine synthase